MVALANFNPIWFVRGVRPLFAYLLLWFAVPHHAICKPRELRTPPMGETITERVMRGGSAEITLKAFEGRGNPLEYNLVSGPQHGRLGSLQQADRNRQGFASVVYTHGNDEDSTSDEFTFRARSLVGGGVSSPIKVKLQIVDAPPQLQVTPGADFSAVAGESDRQQIILANVGGGLIEGRVAPKDPFHVEGEDRFSLGRGAMTNIVIRFSPTRIESVGPQKLAPAPADPGATITLRGEVSAPFEASAEPLKVDATGTRSGLIVISNLASAPLAVDIELTPEEAAEVSSREEIPPRSTAQIPVTISSEKAGGAFNLSVALSSPFHRQDLTFEVPAVPPRLEVATPELDFRELHEAGVLVRNSGGLEGRFSLELPPGIRALEGAASFTVAPGSQRSVVLRHDDTKSNAAETVLVVDCGKSGKIPVPLLFAAPEPSPSPTAAPEPVVMRAPEAPKPWKLNEDLNLGTEGDGRASVMWISEKAGWKNPVLEIIDSGGQRPYHAKPEHRSWWLFLADWWSGRKAEAQEALAEREEFFQNRLTPPGEEKEDTGEPGAENIAWQRAGIAARDAADEKVSWRLSAEDTRSGLRQAASDDFVLDTANNQLVTAEQKETAKQEPVRPPPNPFLPPESRLKISGPNVTKQRMTATRKIEDESGYISERTRATVKVVIEAGPNITGFRLERCAKVDKIDLTTKLSQTHFEPIWHDGNATIDGIYPTEREGKKLVVVVAAIDGLLPGTVTFWRLVPLAGEESLTPTSEFELPTKPPWQFPWRAFFLGLLTALLVSVLWLRHKSRKASRS